LRDAKAEGKLKAVEKMDSIFGLDLLKKAEVLVPAEIKKLVQEREEARKKKNFKLADEIREKIKKQGWQIDDTAQGPRLRKI
jgi:cysteinyl-tRNA synthetase